MIEFELEWGVLLVPPDDCNCAGAICTRLPWSSVPISTHFRPNKLCSTPVTLSFIDTRR